MRLKMTFLGSGSAFSVGPENFHSNILLQLENDTLLLDAGSDLRHSLRDQKLSHLDIKNVYISHLHGDHAGGLEWLALSTYFDPQYKGRPNLFVSEQIIDDLWNKTLSGGLSTIENKRPAIDIYFNPLSIKDKGSFFWHGIEFKLIKTIHYCSDFKLMPTYGLIFSCNKVKILFTADTQNTPDHLTSYYEEADIIFHDCETSSNKSTVHAHYSELKLLPEPIKNKMWLYHYNPGALPDALKDGFLGFVGKGQSFFF